MGVYYRPPDQVEPTDEAIFLQLQEASRSQSLVLLGDFNHPDICWKSSMVSCRQSRRFLECIEDDFFSQILTPLLDLMLTNAISSVISRVEAAWAVVTMHWWSSQS